MESIVGIFNSFADARRAAAILRSLGIPEQRITVLSSHTPENEIEARVPTEETEQPGMGSAVGATVGAAIGTAAGATAGAAVASLLVPGVGPVLALGLIGAALFGTGAGVTGAFAGQALDHALEEGLPRDELYIYEDALRRGRSVCVAFADNEQMAENARAALNSAGAESVDAAREGWWLGLRDVEQEHYTKQGGDFNVAEAKYRLGFEAALHPNCRGKSCGEAAENLLKRYGRESRTSAFREGYDRGQRYYSLVIERDVARSKEQGKKRAA
jgi:hypothetical protein